MLASHSSGGIPKPGEPWQAFGRAKAHFPDQRRLNGVRLQSAVLHDVRRDGYDRERQLRGDFQRRKGASKDQPEKQRRHRDGIHQDVSPERAASHFGRAKSRRHRHAEEQILPRAARDSKDDQQD